MECISVSTTKEWLIVLYLFQRGLDYQNEIAEFRFAGDYTAYLPYSTNKEKPMAMAFQNTYEVKPLSEAPQELAFCR